MADISKISIRYNFDTDETSIQETKDFRNLPKIHQLDSLQDAIGILNSIYNRKLDEFHNKLIEGDDHYPEQFGEIKNRTYKK